MRERSSFPLSSGLRIEILPLAACKWLRLSGHQPPLLQTSLAPGLPFLRRERSWPKVHMHTFLTCVLATSCLAGHAHVFLFPQNSYVCAIFPSGQDPGSSPLLEECRQNSSAWHLRFLQSNPNFSFTLLSALSSPL